MPPKKKKGGKKSGKKKSDKKGGSKSPTAKVLDVFNEVTKEFFLIQVRDLEQKIARYQERCDKLELRNNDVESMFEQQASDKKEIVSFLKKQLEQRSDEIADLQEKIITINQTKEMDKDRYELEIETLKTQMQEVKDQLTSENMVLGGKLASLEEFRIQKENLLNKFSEMEELLSNQEINHKEQIYQLERKGVVDKDRLKKEMFLRVNTVAAEFRKVSNKQMAETTKRTIRENVMINSQLSKMSDKTMELISENDDVKVKEKNLRQQLEILEDNEKELVKKNITNQKVIRMLTEKAQQQERTIEDLAAKEVDFGKTQIELDNLKNQIESLTKAQESLTEEKDHMQKVCKQHREEICQLQEDKEYLIGILSDATSVIKTALDHNQDSTDAALTEMKNTNLLYKVTEILNLAVEMGVGIDPKDFATKRKGKAKRKIINLGPPVFNKSALRGNLPSPSKPLDHYKLGDLGLVPMGKACQSKSAGYVDSQRVKNNNGKATFYTDEQLANGTPRQSAYDLVKSGMTKFPVLSPIS